jgi:hypothetical protein
VALGKTLPKAELRTAFLAAPGDHEGRGWATKGGAGDDGPGGRRASTTERFRSTAGGTFTHHDGVSR